MLRRFLIFSIVVFALFPKVDAAAQSVDDVPYLGVFYNGNVEAGILIGDVMPDSPAAGLRPGDNILTVDAQAVTVDTFGLVLHTVEPDTNVRFDLLRDDMAMGKSVRVSLFSADAVLESSENIGQLIPELDVHMEDRVNGVFVSSVSVDRQNNFDYLRVGIVSCQLTVKPCA